MARTLLRVTPTAVQVLGAGGAAAGLYLLAGLAVTLLVTGLLLVAVGVLAERRLI